MKESSNVTENDSVTFIFSFFFDELADGYARNIQTACYCACVERNCSQSSLAVTLLLVAQRFAPDYVLLGGRKVEASLRILSRPPNVRSDAFINHSRWKCQYAGTRSVSVVRGAFSSLSTLTDTFPRTTVFDWSPWCLSRNRSETAARRNVEQWRAYKHANRNRSRCTETI